MCENVGLTMCAVNNAFTVFCFFVVPCYYMAKYSIMMVCAFVHSLVYNGRVDYAEAVELGHNVEYVLHRLELSKK